MDSNFVCYLNDPTYTTMAQYALLATITGLACARVAGLGKKSEHPREVSGLTS